VPDVAEVTSFVPSEAAGPPAGSALSTPPEGSATPSGRSDAARPADAEPVDTSATPSAGSPPSARSDAPVPTEIEAPFPPDFTREGHAIVALAARPADAGPADTAEPTFSDRAPSSGSDGAAVLDGIVAPAPSAGSATPWAGSSRSRRRSSSSGERFSVRLPSGLDAMVRDRCHEERRSLTDATGEVFELWGDGLPRVLVDQLREKAERERRPVGEVLREAVIAGLERSKP
jgi:hypothetical protein